MVVEVSRRQRQVGMRARVKKLALEWGAESSFLRPKKVWLEMSAYWRGRAFEMQKVLREGRKEERWQGQGRGLGSVGKVGSADLCLALKPVLVAVELYGAGSEQTRAETEVRRAG